MSCALLARIETLAAQLRIQFVAVCCRVQSKKHVNLSFFPRYIDMFSCEAEIQNIFSRSIKCSMTDKSLAIVKHGNITVTNFAKISRTNFGKWTVNSPIQRIVLAKTHVLGYCSATGVVLRRTDQPLISVPVAVQIPCGAGCLLQSLRGASMVRA